MGYLREGKYYFKASVVISISKPPLPNLGLLFLPTRVTSKVSCTRSTTSRTHLKVLRTGQICRILASCTLLLVVAHCFFNLLLSTRTLDLLRQCSYHMEEQQTTDRHIALSTTEAELADFVSFVRSVRHTMRILHSMGLPHYGVNTFEDNRSSTAICTNNVT